GRTVEADSVSVPNREAAFSVTCQHRTEHETMSTSDECLADVNRVLNAAVSDDPRTPSNVSTFHDCRQLRHSYSSHETGRTDATGSDAHLDVVGTSVFQQFHPFGGADVSSHQSCVRETHTREANEVDEVCQIPVRHIDAKPEALLVVDLRELVEFRMSHSDANPSGLFLQVSIEDLLNVNVFAQDSGDVVLLQHFRHLN